MWGVMGALTLLIRLVSQIGPKVFWVIWLSGIGAFMGWMAYTHPLCNWMRRLGKERPNA